MKFSKIAHLLLAIVLVIFGLLQVNDSDFYIWTPVYFITAYFPFKAFRGSYKGIYALRYAMVLLICFLFYIPDFIAWVQDGLPDITGSMQAESMYIEFIREFFGLLICIFVSLGYYVHSKAIRK